MLILLLAFIFPNTLRGETIPIVDNAALSDKVHSSDQSSERSLTVQGQILENTEPPYPLIGVSVQIKNVPNSGTISDNNGYFSIKAKRGDILVFSYIVIPQIGVIILIHSIMHVNIVG